MTNARLGVRKPGVRHTMIVAASILGALTAATVATIRSSAVWGLTYADESAYLHVYVNRLRRKLSAASPAAPLEGLIETEPGIGYRIADHRSLSEEWPSGASISS